MAQAVCAAAVQAAAGGVPQAGQRAHAAVLQQLSGRTPQFEDGTKLYERVEATRLMPLGCSRYARNTTPRWWLVALVDAVRSHDQLA